MREDRPDDRGIVERGDQAEAAPTMGTRQDVEAERPVHQGRPAPGASGEITLYHRAGSAEKAGVTLTTASAILLALGLVRRRDKRISRVTVQATG